MCYKNSCFLNVSYDLEKKEISVSGIVFKIKENGYRTSCMVTIN